MDKDSDAGFAATRPTGPSNPQPCGPIHGTSASSTADRPAAALRRHRALALEILADPRCGHDTLCWFWDFGKIWLGLSDGGETFGDVHLFDVLPESVHAAAESGQVAAAACGANLLLTRLGMTSAFRYDPRLDGGWFLRAAAFDPSGGADPSDLGCEPRLAASWTSRMLRAARRVGAGLHSGAGLRLRFSEETSAHERLEILAALGSPDPALLDLLRDLAKEHDGADILLDRVGDVLSVSALPEAGALSGFRLHCAAIGLPDAGDAADPRSNEGLDLRAEKDPP